MKARWWLVIAFVVSACQLGPLTNEDLISRDTCATCPQATLTGSVVDLCTGEALNARVTIAGASTCSGSGKLPYFELHGLKPGGPYTLAVGKLGYRSYVTTRDLTPGNNTQSLISLEPSDGCPASPPASVCECTDSFCQSQP